MARSIKELGDTQRCPKCKQFGKMITLKVSPKGTKVEYLCEKCVKNFSDDYTIEEFTNMANGLLVDDKWIHDFQKKYMIATSTFIPIKNGLDGTFFSRNNIAVKRHGRELICKCGEFYKMDYKGHKKDTLFFNLECNICGAKKLKLKQLDFADLGLAGIISKELTATVKEDFETDTTPWDSSDTYATPASILSADARSRLGMEDDSSMEELEGYICPKCGAALSVEMKKYGKCPTCGTSIK